MTVEELLAACKDLSFTELSGLPSLINREIEKREKSLINSVVVEKNKDTIRLSHPDNGKYVCRQVAFARRWRMWKMIPGKTGFKRGPMVVEESLGGLDSLKIQVALGHYKDVK